MGVYLRDLGLAQHSPEERREVHKLLDLTVEAHHDGSVRGRLDLERFRQQN
jgi:hypothetical protein